MQQNAAVSTATSEAPPATGFAGARLRAVVGGSIGNLVEWYDWYIYSAFALYFSPAFFPPGDRTAQLLNSAAIFALGFIMRPSADGSSAAMLIAAGAVPRSASPFSSCAPGRSRLLQLLGTQPSGSHRP